MEFANSNVCVWVCYTRRFEPWYIYSWKKTANLRTQKLARERMHTNVIRLCMYCVGTHLKHKHSLCIKSGNVDGDDDDGGSGDGGSNSSSINLSINQVHYSLRRICKKTTKTTSAQQSIAVGCLVSWSVVWPSMCSDLTSTLHTHTHTRSRCKNGSYVREQFMLAPAPSHQLYSKLKE